MARLTVRVQPGARRTAFTGWFGDHPRLAVAAPPVGGAANAAVCSYLASVFGVRARDVRVVVGASARTKHVVVDGVTDEELAVVLRQLIGER